MRIIDTSPITDSAKFPIKKGTLDFLQAAYGEVVSAILIGIIGIDNYDPTVVYIIYGIVNTGAGAVYNITAGAVFYNGEVFYVDAASFTATGSNVAIFQIVITQFLGDGTNADPVTFTDSSLHNVHDIRKIQIVQGASGSGLGNLSAGSRMPLPVPPQLQLTAPVTGAYAGNILQLVGAYPNIVAFVPPNGNLNPIIYAGSKSVGDLAGGNNTVSITFPDVGTGNYYVVGTWVSNPGSVNPGADSTIVWSISGRTNTGFILTCRETQATVQDVSFEYILHAK